MNMRKIKAHPVGLQGRDHSRVVTTHADESVGTSEAQAPGFFNPIIPKRKRSAGVNAAVNQIQQTNQAGRLPFTG
jgi:hypothetical protein